jgi:hypothetical protein
VGKTCPRPDGIARSRSPSVTPVHAILRPLTSRAVIPSAAYPFAISSAERGRRGALVSAPSQCNGLSAEVMLRTASRSGGASVSASSCASKSQVEAAAEAIGRVSIPGDNGEARLNEPATRLLNERDSRKVPPARSGCWPQWDRLRLAVTVATTISTSSPCYPASRAA